MRTVTRFVIIWLCVMLWVAALEGARHVIAAKNPGIACIMARRDQLSASVWRIALALMGKVTVRKDCHATG